MTLSNRLKIGIIGTVVTLLALYFIATQLNLELFLQAWRTANYWYVLPGILLLFVGLITRAFRWRVLLDNELPFSHTFNIMNVAYLVNNILPLRIGEVARVYLVSRTKEAIPIPTTTGTVIVERLLDLLAVGVIAMLALMLGSVPDEIRIASIIATIVAILGFIVLVFLAGRREWTLSLFGKVLTTIPIVKRYTILETWFGQFLSGLSPITRPSSLFQTIVWTTISWAFSIASGYVLMFAFFETGNIVATMLFIVTASFAIALPAVPGNVGTFEASILLALTASGYEQSNTAIALAVMVHAVTLLLYLITGSIGLIQEGISVGQLSQAVRQMQETTTESG